MSTTSLVRGQTLAGVPVTGTFTPTRFVVNSAGKMIARGTLNLVTRGVTPERLAPKVVSIPVQSVNSGAPDGATALTSGNLAAAALPAGACSILDLVLGPLDLDLLGLVIHLDKVVLTIIAQSGAGQLLGNLLCAVAHLLDGFPPTSQLTQITELLNAILAILNA